MQSDLDSIQNPYYRRTEAMIGKVTFHTRHKPRYTIMQQFCSYVQLISLYVFLLNY